MPTPINATAFTDTTIEATATFTVAASTPGTALFVFASYNTKTRTVGSITDSAGNTGWAQITGEGASTSGSAFIWWLPPTAHLASITSVSVTTTSSLTTKGQFGYFEVPQLLAFGDVSTIVPQTVASTSAVATVSTTRAPDFAVAMIGNVQATAVASPFTLVSAAGGTGSGIGNSVAYADLRPLGSLTATFTIASNTSETALATFPIAGYVPNRQKQQRVAPMRSRFW